jgi:DNA-binding response OmpR family regulator
MRSRTRTVLVIEDEADIRNFISRVLELEGYNVMQAGDGIKGMEIITHNKIDLVLLDLRLPGPDGWTVLREIRHNSALAVIPVVVLTAIAENLQRKKTLRMGAAGYLIKPLSAHNLSRAVAAFLKTKKNPQPEVPALTWPASRSLF